MSTTKSEMVEQLVVSAIAAAVEFERESLRGNHAQNWHALRISPSGEITVIHEPSKTLPESEYFGRAPHPLTFLKEPGNCFHPNPDTGWRWDEEDSEGKYIGFIPAVGPADWMVWENVSDTNRAKLLANGWFRFSLDLNDWVGETIEVREDEIRESIASWADENFQPDVSAAP